MRRIKTQQATPKEGSSPKADESLRRCESWDDLELPGDEKSNESSPVGLNDGADTYGQNRRQEPRKFDLEERTARYGEAVVRFSKRVPRDPSNNRLVDQVVGSATSVGANYMEASEGVSKKDFKFSISRCVKEAKESCFFLRMIAASELSLADDARQLYREGRELMLIFAEIRRK